MDYLPAQASSVPSERIFSAGAETDTRCRNRLIPALFEQLQMLKFMLKKAQLDFGEKWNVLVEDLEDENYFLDCALSKGKNAGEYPGLLGSVVEPITTHASKQVNESTEEEWFDLD